MRRSFSLLCLAALLVAGGCQSPSPVPNCNSLACVEIIRHAPMDIARTVSAVFTEAGYQVAPLPPNNQMMLMFEREGSTGETLAYGDWSGKKPWKRVRIHIKRVGEEKSRVECDVYRVLDHGDPRFEEEAKLTSLKRKPYQELLDQVKARLEQPGS
jgi:hypothetical protein